MMNIRQRQNCRKQRHEISSDSKNVPQHSDEKFLSHAEMISPREIVTKLYSAHIVRPAIQQP